MSKRNFASLLSITTQSSNRLQKVPTRSRPTCSQTEATSLSAPNVSVARVFFQPSVIGKGASGVHVISFHNIMKCDVDIRVNLYCSTLVKVPSMDWRVYLVDDIGSIHDVFSRASLSSFFSKGCYVERRWLHPRWFPMWLRDSFGAAFFFPSLSLSDFDTLRSCSMVA